MNRHSTFMYLAACLALGAALPAGAALVDYPFELIAVSEDGETLLYADNDGDAPITVHLTVADAPGDTSPRRLNAIVQPQTRVALGAVEDDATVEYSYYVGRMDAPAGAHRCYRLPYGSGYAYPVTQAYGGLLTSHDDVQSRYAVDFAMPEGTPIVAARAGIVLDVTLDYREGGMDSYFLQKANTVTIVHDDGTIAQYAHLAPRPPLVHPGQRVAAGHHIAYSGNTGYSSAPHLHFVVSRPGLVGGKVVPVSLPFRFCGDGAVNALAPVSADPSR